MVMGRERPRPLAAQAAPRPVSGVAHAPLPVTHRVGTTVFRSVSRIALIERVNARAKPRHSVCEPRVPVTLHGVRRKPTHHKAFWSVNLALINCNETGRTRLALDVGMVARGRLRNGVVVLDNGAHLPEGQEVMVLTPVTVPQNAQPHGILDIAPVSVGAVLHPFTADDDLLGNMLEGRS